MPASYSIFQVSMERCLANPTFIDRFYARFLLTHPEIAEKFARTDLKKQAHVLRASLYLMLRAAAGHEDGIAHLHDVGRTHTRRQLGIERSHFDTWLDTLLGVARETDPGFDTLTEAAWRESLVPCIEAIVSTATRHE